MLFYALQKNQKRWLHVVLMIWILAMLTALLSVQRDVRYFIDVATFPVLFLAAEVVDIDRKRLGRALEVVLVLFLIIFMTLGVVIGFQIDSGISEASQFTNQHFQNPTVGVNNNGYLAFLSVNDTVIAIPFTAAGLNASLATTHYDVILLWQQSRTYSYSTQYIEVLDSHFSHHVQFGLSSFSYVTVYYNSFSS
jgi:hypothetical protein